MRAVPLVPADPRLAEPRARPDVAPVPVHLLADLAAHRGLEAGEVVAGLLLGAVGDGETRVVEGVGALGVAVGPAHPALDRGAFIKVN